MVFRREASNNELILDLCALSSFIRTTGHIKASILIANIPMHVLGSEAVEHRTQDREV